VPDGGSVAERPNREESPERSEETPATAQQEPEASAQPVLLNRPNDREPW